MKPMTDKQLAKLLAATVKATALMKVFNKELQTVEIALNKLHDQIDDAVVAGKEIKTLSAKQKVLNERFRYLEKFNNQIGGIVIRQFSI